MAESFAETILKLYKKDFPEEVPECIQNRGISARFGWEPHGPLHYVTFPDPAMGHMLAFMGGDILEIGAHEGEFTVLLCEYAKVFDLSLAAQKHVYVIDPWDGRQQGNEEVYQKFLNYMKPYHNWTALRAGSETAQAKEWIASMNLCFAWVDGLHEYNAAKADIATAKTGFKGPGIIGMDDVRGPFHFNAGLMRASEESEDDQWKHVKSPDNFTHSFLVREA